MAWIQLKKAERGYGDPPALTMNPDLAADLRNEQGLFWKTVTDILGALNRGDPKGVSENKLQEWRREALRLKAEMENLALPKTF